MKRFLDLQANVNYVRGNRSCPSLAARSASSLSSSSWLSLDDGCLSAPGDTPVHQRDVMRELRNRTHSNYTSLIMRQSSVDLNFTVTSSRGVGYEPRAVSLMDVHHGRAHSSDGAEYSTLTAGPGYSSTESDDDSNYDTLTKTSGAKLSLSQASSVGSGLFTNHAAESDGADTLCVDLGPDSADHFAAECMRILDSVRADTFDDESNCDTLTKQPSKHSAHTDDDSRSSDHESSSQCHTTEQCARTRQHDVNAATDEQHDTRSAHSEQLAETTDSSLEHFDVDSLDECFSSSDDEQTYSTHL